MELIGQGGVWKVYKIENQNSVFRIPKASAKSSIDNFIENFDLIKNLGVSTLKKVEKHEINGFIGVLCDNVNWSEEKVYVTYNSLYSDSQKYLHLLSKDFLENKEERKSSLAEEFRYRNKVDELTNFEEFIIKVKTHLKIATKQDILIEFDSYFFGTDKQATITEIDYKIVDLDHIFTNTCKIEDDLFSMNLLEFSRAIHGFLKYFVTDKNQSKYLDYLKE